MWAYWWRLTPVESVVAPMSSSTIGPWSVTIWTASAGRSTLRSRPRLRIAEATPAPVCPAVTTASARPSLTSRMQTLMLASRLRRTAAAGCSSMVTDSLAATISTLAGRVVDQRRHSLLITDEQHVRVRCCGAPSRWHRRRPRRARGRRPSRRRRRGHARKVCDHRPRRVSISNPLSLLDRGR